MGTAADDSLEAFRQLVAVDGAPIALLRAAATLPRYADEGCDPDRVVRQVAVWGERLRARLPADASPLHRLRQLNHFFFDELGFRANAGALHDPANSYLHCVIARRTGLPITLSILYVEIGRAAGLRLFGVSFPGHFLAKLALSGGSMLIDVYGGGIALSADELQVRLKAAIRGELKQPLQAYLRSASEREILARMLRNLKAIHLQAGQWPPALAVIDRLVVLLPDSAEERRDRALVYERLECPRAAAEDLTAYLSMRPDPPDLQGLQRKLARWRRAARALN